MHAIEWTKICCPVDGSDQARKAMRYAADLSKRFGAELTLLHVENVRDHWSDAHAAEFKTEAEKDGAVKVVFARENGEPSLRIPEYTKAHGFSLIVMGTHGRTGRLGSLVGSVAEAVMRNASCPVMTLK